jgi:hypothetical protein
MTNPAGASGESLSLRIDTAPATDYRRCGATSRPTAIVGAGITGITAAYLL